MEDHFIVVWCNFGMKDEFNQKKLTDIKNFRTSAKKTILQKFWRYFAEIINPPSLLRFERSASEL